MAWVILRILVSGSLPTTCRVTGMDHRDENISAVSGPRLLRDPRTYQVRSKTQSWVLRVDLYRDEIKLPVCCSTVSSDRSDDEWNGCVLCRLVETIEV